MVELQDTCSHKILVARASFRGEQEATAAEINSEMLQELVSEVHEIVCTDEIDQTSST